MGKPPLFGKENVKYDLHDMSKREAILLAGDLLVKRGYVQESYVKSMLEREELTSTYIGNGIGIPHGTDASKKEILNSGIVVLHFKQGIDYDGETVNLVIGIAGKDNEHLEILSKIAVVLSEEDEVNKVVNSSSLEELYAHLDAINQ